VSAPAGSTAALRVASLVPSVTELVCALGLGPRLVARTGFCVHPADELAAVPKVGGTKDVNLAKLRRLAPTHVLVNVDENRLDTVEALRGFVPQVLVTHPCDPEDNLALLDQMTAAFGTEPGVAGRAAALAAELRQALVECAAPAGAAERVLYLIWREPWMTVARDTYIARMLERVGWRTLPAVDGGPRGAARYPIVEPGEPWLAEVDRVLLSSEPYRFTNAHLAEAQALCPRARVQFVDGELISWYGPRAAAGLRYLRGLAADRPTIA
jgi:ABC-type Fe3+-hydroxamate transport system substrate-binding protein